MARSMRRICIKWGSTSRGRVLVWGSVLVLGLNLIGGCAPLRRGRPPAIADSSPAVNDHQAAVQRWLQGPRLLKVGLATNPADAEVILAGRHELYAGKLGRRQSLSVGPGVISFKADASAVIVGTPDGKNYRLPLPLTLMASVAGPWHFGRHDYAGNLRLELHAAELTFINIVDLETYLRGVVPWEIGRPGEKGLAALEAQAVAARTYTVSHRGERSEQGFDVWADERDQVYRGLDGIDSWCDLAVENTTGMVLRYQGREIAAYYSSTCGGVSSAIEEVWPRPAREYLSSHADVVRGSRVFCGDSKWMNWSSSWTVKQIDTVLHKSLPEYYSWWSVSPARQGWAGQAYIPKTAGASAQEVGQLLDLKIVSRTKSGRVGILEIETSRGRWRIRGDRVRWVLAPASGNPRILRSAWFNLEVERDADQHLVKVTATGRGFGHGIGMCQTGALKMAALGYGSREILAHYYPGAQLESAWK